MINGDRCCRYLTSAHSCPALGRSLSSSLIQPVPCCDFPTRAHLDTLLSYISPPAPETLSAVHLVPSVTRLFWSTAAAAACLATLASGWLLQTPPRALPHSLPVAYHLNSCAAAFESALPSIHQRHAVAPVANSASRHPATHISVVRARLGARVRPPSPPAIASRTFRS